MELRGPRVLIRPWKYHDDELADDWPPYNDPFDPLWNLPRPASFGGGMWNALLEYGIYRRSWAVENNNGALIGRISLREIDERRGQARLGVTFGAPYVGRGLGTEALTLFLDYYFETLRYHLMALDVAAPNVRAVRCYTRLASSTSRATGAAPAPYLIGGCSINRCMHHCAAISATTRAV